VSPISKSQLLENYEISPDSISEVYHTLRDDFLNSNGHEPSIDCIFIGRLVPQKGLQELLDFFSDKSDKTLTIIGDGKLENLVETYANRYDNITFKGQISNGDELRTILQKHRYLVLNSIKTEKWEELFGIVIIESMSQGVVPISSNHSGPKSIITNEIGYLYDEGQLKKSLNEILNQPIDEHKSKNALKASKFYSVENISQFWAPIEN
ncbi:MAG: glycosyltransferase, partial [Flavobacteriaceae bacterium]|nr:glycosyltransferase [Flavobacteriaceae bacterium]